MTVTSGRGPVPAEFRHFLGVSLFRGPTASRRGSSQQMQRAPMASQCAAGRRAIQFCSMLSLVAATIYRISQSHFIK